MSVGREDRRVEGGGQPALLERRQGLGSILGPQPEIVVSQRPIARLLLAEDELIDDDLAGERDRAAVGNDGVAPRQHVGIEGAVRATAHPVQMTDGHTQPPT